MDWIWYVIALLVVCFGFILFVGPPYLPTLDKQVKVALDMLKLKKGATIIELGSGDGKVLLEAAKRGWNVVGYELNPLLVIVSFVRTWKYRKQVRIIWGNFWRAKWPEADGIFAFVLPKYMEKLDNKIIQWHKRPVKLASFAFVVPGRSTTREKDGVYLYEYK